MASNELLRMLVPTRLPLSERRSMWICVFVAVMTAIVPLGRAMFRFEVNYNEGWNVYNADTVAHHQVLYPVRYGWVSANYPMLSFWVMAKLHTVTHEYLFTARVVSVLSLIACACLVGGIVRALGAGMWASALASLFCWAVFCANAESYVGMDDPQLLAQASFAAGLLLYVGARPQRLRSGLAALVFVVAVFLKHNPIDIPMAVMIDLLLVSAPLALWFAACGLAGLAAGVGLSIHFGGPFFVSQMLAPRVYSPLQVPGKALIALGPVLPLIAVAVYTAWRERLDPARRLASILLVTSVLMGAYFSGARGVSINAYFSVLMAVSILLGLFLDRLRASRREKGDSRAAWAAACCFLWLGVPLLISGNWNPIRRLHEAGRAQGQFAADVAFLRARPGAALCESLLECYAAEKPYLYDPFNATRLIEVHRLEAAPLVEALREHRFSAVQTDGLLDRADETQRDRFAAEIRAAIQANYTPAVDVPSPGEGGEARVIYVPRSPAP